MKTTHRANKAPRNSPIVENHSIGTGKVDTEAATSSTEDEAEYLGVVIESVHQSLALVNAGSSIKPQVSVGMEIQKRLENIEHLAHLCKDENSMTTSFKIIE